jgi:peptidoglycan/LPS O-acetylase OafA/YrhL
MKRSISQNLPELDGWRGIAILFVLFSHFISSFYGLGNFGVAIFFVLSGYLMSDLLFIKKVNLNIFF